MAYETIRRGGLSLLVLVSGTFRGPPKLLEIEGEYVLGLRPRDNRTAAVDWAFELIQRGAGWTACKLTTD